MKLHNIPCVSFLMLSPWSCVCGSLINGLHFKYDRCGHRRMCVCVCVCATHYVSIEILLTNAELAHFNLFLQVYCDTFIWHISHRIFRHRNLNYALSPIKIQRHDFTTTHIHFVSVHTCSFRFCLRSRFILWATHIFHFPFFCFVLFLSSIND